MAPENDIDYSLSRVPDEAKQPFWRILFIRIGAICCVSQLMLGAALGYGLTFWDAFLATMLGSVLLQVVSWALGTAAAREGLSTSLLSRWTGFGKVGSALFGGVVAISMVGWFGVQNAVFGQGMAEIVPFTDFLGTQEILPGIMLESRPSTSSGHHHRPGHHAARGVRHQGHRELRHGVRAAVRDRGHRSRSHHPAKPFADRTSHHALRDRRCRWARQPPWWRAASLRAPSARPTTRDS